MTDSIKGNPFRRNVGQTAVPISEQDSTPAPDQDARLERLRGVFGRALAARKAKQPDNPAREIDGQPRVDDTPSSPAASDSAPQDKGGSPSPSVKRNPFGRNRDQATAPSPVSEAIPDAALNRLRKLVKRHDKSTSESDGASHIENTPSPASESDGAPRNGEASPSPSVERNRFGRTRGQASAPSSAPEPMANPEATADTRLNRLRRIFARSKRSDAQHDAAPSQNDDVTPPPAFTRSPFRRKQAQTSAPASAPLPLLVQLRRQLGGAFAYAAVLTVFINVAMLFVPLYSMIIFDRVLQSKSYDTLTMLSIVCVIGMLLYGALDFCRSLIFIVMADKLTRGLNLSTLRAAIARSLSGEPSAAAQAVRDLDSLRTFASGGSPIVSLDLIWTPIVLVVLYMLHPWYGHYALFCSGVLFVLSIANDLTTRDSLIEANTAAANSLSDLSTALRQRELIDGLGMLPEIARHWMRRQNKVLAQAAVVSRRSTRFAVVAKTARLGMQAVGMAVGVILVIHNEASPGSLVGASILLGKLLLPFEQLITAWRQWIAALASWRRLSDLLTTTPIRSDHLIAESVEGRLVLDRVGFAPATASAPIIEEISLTIEPGEVVAIVGPSGSGKSTLARLVMGILQPTSGQVTLDGIPTSKWDRTELARHVGYLAQSVGLLDGTILDNIARMDVADSAAAIDAANRAGVHELIGRLRDGYGTNVGDSGQALSGGTRQRIALARALYGQPKLLVLDEPNANLDHEGEQTLVRVIRQVRATGAAVLLITHRPSILAAVDRVIGVERGRITRIEHAPARPELANPGRAMAQAAG